MKKKNPLRKKKIEGENWGGSSVACTCIPDPRKPNTGGKGIVFNIYLGCSFNGGQTEKKLSGFIGFVKCGGRVLKSSAWEVGVQRKMLGGGNRRKTKIVTVRFVGGGFFPGRKKNLTL